MTPDLLSNIALQIEPLKADLERAQAAVAFLQDAGEPFIEEKTKVDAMGVRLERWTAALGARGVNGRTPESAA